MTNELIVYGASDDLVEFDGIFVEEFDAYSGWYGTVTDENGEYVRLHITYGEDGVEWKLRAENPFLWDITVGERPDREGDPALFITTPTGAVSVTEEEKFWDNPHYDVVAM